MSVRWQIVLSMLLLSSAIVLVMGALSVRLSDQILEDRAKVFLSAIMDRSARELNQQIQTAEKEVDTVSQDFLDSFEEKREARDPSYLPAYLESITRSVQQAADFNPSKTAYLILYNPSKPGSPRGGISLSDTGRKGVPHPSDTAEVLRRLVDVLGRPKAGTAPTKNWVSQPKNRLFDCFTLIPDQRGNLTLVGVGVDKELIKDWIRRSPYLSSDFLFLTDDADRVVYHPQVEEGTVLVPLVAAEAAQGSGSDGSVRFSKQTDVDRNEVLFGYLKLQNSWRLGLQVRTSDIREGMGSMVAIVFSVMALAMVGAVAIGLLAGNRISRPYIYLSKEIEKIGSGDYEIELNPEYLSRSDEAGILTRSIDQMVLRQKESFNQIRNYSLNLEKIIEVRTSELVQANASLAKTEKIASLTYMVGGIAHQMNTPMGNALMAVSFLRGQIENIRTKLAAEGLRQAEMGDWMATAEETCSMIQKSLERSIRLVEQFKGLAPGRQDATQGTHNLGQAVRYWASETCQKFPETACRFTWEIPDDLEFYCNADNLNNIFRELMANSFFHGFQETPEPEIRIQITPVETPGRGIQISYSDNGRGITPDQAKELFTPFYTTRMGQDHIGLGLNLVYNLVLGVFNGDIAVDDSVRPGLGYRITLYQESGV